MLVNLSKKFITKNLLPHLSSSNLGRKPKVPLWRIVKAIIYRLKSGCQWRELPMAIFCRRIIVSWNTVYYHFSKWSKDGSWKQLWINLLSLEREKLDMSSVQLDGTHTPAKRGGEAVAYQGRKKSKTTNVLILADKQGLPLAISDPMAGNHNDLFDIEFLFNKMIQDLAQSQIKVNGLFLNADAGFDSQQFRRPCYTNDIIANVDFNKRNS
ncbi:MAG: transposase, partial [Bacteroidota bacterium]